MFSCKDHIRRNGHVVELSIDFSELPSSLLNREPCLFLYILASTKQKDRFVVIHRYQLSKKEIEQLLDRGTDQDGQIRRVTIRGPTFYVETGQFVGVGFGEYSGEPYLTKGCGFYYGHLDRANNVLGTSQAQKFVKQENYAVTYSFRVKPDSSLSEGISKNLLQLSRL